MSEFNFTTIIPSPPDKLIAIALDVEKYPQFFQYLKEIKILEKTEKSIHTLEKFSLNISKFTHLFEQETMTTQINSNQLEAKILSGPLKGTIVKTIYEKHDESFSKINVFFNLHVSLKYRFLLPIITKRIKMATIAILYKQHACLIE